MAKKDHKPKKAVKKAAPKSSHKTPAQAAGKAKKPIDKKAAKAREKAREANKKVERLVQKGRERGFVTYDEILKEFPTIEDDILYNEPPVWHHPVRQVLGGVLLDAGRAKEAEAVYRADLARVRENGWSLFGLARSLEAQGRPDEAAEVRRRFETAWKRADISLTSSRIMTDDRRTQSTR